MKKLFSIILMTMMLCTMGYAEEADSNQKGNLPAAQVMNILEVFCQNYYSACFSGKEYIPGSLIIKSIGIDQRTGGTHVTGLHSYQGQPVPFKGRKTHNDVQFKAVIIVQQNGYYVIFDKWYEPDWTDRKGHWETGQRLLQ